MQTTTSKYLWFMLIGLIIAGAGIFFWLSSGNRQSEPAPSSEPISIRATATPMSASFESPISPISPVNPVAINQNSLEADPEKIQLMIDQALQAQEQKDYTRVIELTDNILADDPANFIAFNLRGSAYMETGELQKALDDYTSAIELGPLFPHAFYNRGRLLRLQGKYNEAIADLQKAIDLSPMEFGYRANGNIGLIYYQQGNYDQAIEAFAESISLNKDNRADVYFLRGETYAAKGDFEAAIQDYQAAIERFPSYVDAYKSLGFAYSRTNQLPQAEEALTKAEDFAPSNPEVQLYLSLVQLANGQIEAAQASVQQAGIKFDTLTPKQRELVRQRMVDALQSFAETNPDQTSQVDQLLKLLPGD